jgi:hypothetical protein
MSDYICDICKGKSTIRCICKKSSYFCQFCIYTHMSQTQSTHLIIQSSILPQSHQYPSVLLKPSSSNPSKPSRFQQIKRHIYMPKPNTLYLYKYNYTLNICSRSDLSAYISNAFYFTTICYISHENYLILGFRDSSNTYLYNSRRNTCFKLASMLHARYRIASIYVNSIAYAFGGSIGYSTSNLAERFDFSTNSWRRLPNMLTLRRSASCVEVDNKIYILAGDVNTIEEYSIKYSRFRIVNIITDSSLVLSFIRNNQIYIISEKKLKIYNKNWEVKETLEAWDKSCYSLSNVSIQGDSILYYNSSWNYIEEFKASERRRYKRYSVSS